MTIRSGRETERQWLSQDNDASAVVASGSNLIWRLFSVERPHFTLDATYTLASPQDLIPGVYYLQINQDSTGGRQLNYGVAFVWNGDAEPTLNTAPGAVNVFQFYCDGTALYGRLFYQTPIL